MRRLAGALAALTLLAAALLGALGWHVAGRVHDEALLPSYDRRTRAIYDDAVVVAVDSGTVTLAARRNERGRLEREGSWGILWRGGSGRVGGVVGRSDGTVTRRFTPYAGAPAPGDSVDLRLQILLGDPRSALGLEYTDVAIPSELGPLPAWEVPGSDSTWVIYVHGKGASRTEALRVLGLYADRGFPVLIPAYRNDAGAPPSPDGRYHYGRTEWRDLEAAVRHAIARGARSVVLHGTSMGGGIVTAFLDRSDWSRRAACVVLDAPMLDFEATIDWGAARARVPWVGAPLPGPSVAFGKAIAAWRDGVDWAALDHGRGLDSLHAPLLILHGLDDSVVPPATSWRFAERFPARVMVVTFPRADHAEGWNVDPDLYEAAVGSFLERELGGERR